MAERKFWIKVITVLTALTMASYTQAQMKKIVSPLSEYTHQNNQACIIYLNSTLAGFFQKFNQPLHASSRMLRIGPDVEQIINKELTNLMLQCRQTPVGSSPQITAHLNQSGRNFYVEQLAIQKLDFKPRLKTEMNNIIKIDNLKARLNYLLAQKASQETLNKQQEKLLKDYREQIRLLKLGIEFMISDKEHERQSGIQYVNKLKEINVELANAPKKYANLKAQHDEIMSKYCNCVKCQLNEKPSLGFYTERSLFVADNKTTTETN
uniref:Uncharacterized protein n=1 Tax=Daphnia magna TaxID=35525 RepID=A0A0P4XN51_9CRUS